MIDVISQLEHNSQTVKKGLEQQLKFLEEIESSQTKLVFEKERTVQNIATLRGALQAYEQSLTLLKKAQAEEETPQTLEEAA